MIPMRTSSIFRSRWMALLWAAGIIWFAVDVASRASPSTANGAANEAGAAPTDATGQPVNAEDVQEFSDALNGL